MIPLISRQDRKKVTATGISRHLAFYVTLSNSEGSPPPKSEILRSAQNDRQKSYANKIQISPHRDDCTTIERIKKAELYGKAA